ncbi:hypothetical protein BDV93DRAFT_564675 [Ceratobasidium sp. AG-I]|nr:hypothetical protein BDV93DRAFT_564675 [Ceratobasidium sp. AG-I]
MDAKVKVLITETKLVQVHTSTKEKLGCADVRVVDEEHELPNLPAADVAEAIQRRFCP